MNASDAIYVGRLLIGSSISVVYCDHIHLLPPQFSMELSTDTEKYSMKAYTWIQNPYEQLNVCI